MVDPKNINQLAKILSYLKSEIAKTDYSEFDKQVILRYNYFDFIMDSLYGGMDKDGKVIRSKYTELNNHYKAIIKTKEEEGDYDADKYEYYVSKFVSTGILKYTGLNLTEFLNLPIYKAESLAKTCEKFAKTEMEAINKTNTKMATLINNTKQGNKDGL